MKNITTIKKTAIEKTAMKKITAKITTTALLFFLALFTLTTCLKAQESGQQARKTGWFVGVSPYFLGAKIKTTTENTTLTERYTEGTRTLDTTSELFSGEIAKASVEFRSSEDGDITSDATIDTFAINAVLDVCADGTYTGAGSYFHRDFHENSNTEPPGTENFGGDISICSNHFQGLANPFSRSLTGVTVDSATLSSSTTSENTPLTGNGLQFGYNFKKFRVSLNSHLWSAGENKLDSQLLLLDYFLPYGLYAGGGFGTAKLDTSIGSASKTAPALHFGYQHNFTNNFSLEAGLLWFGASFSLEKSAAAPEATISDIAILDPDPIDSSALVGGIITITVVGIYSFQDNRDGNALTMDYSNVDNRILVTRTLTATYGAIVESPGDPIETTTPTKITHELEAPTSIFIRFVWKFR